MHPILENGADLVARCCEVACVLFVVVWCIFEDFDGGHLLPLVLLAALPPAQSRHRREAAVP